MRSIPQWLACLYVGIQSMVTRPRYLFLVAVGYLIAGFTLLVLLTFPAGLKRLAAQTGDDDLVVVLPTAALVDEGARNIPPEQVAIVSTLPEIARDEGGRVMAAPQFVAYTRIRRKDGSHHRRRQGNWPGNGETSRRARRLCSGAHANEGRSE